ncbi:MAG: hypothetical protein GF384_00045 [Elusimicrobia bacterium]|nr:hypothetical protein [Elusimicrobiota bacterium]MBD3411487.1 hypothetical protein [Elusimicrobiota bacterium]
MKLEKKIQTKTVAKEDIVRLINEKSDPCISIYMPTYRAGKDTEQNLIRYKNLLHDVQQRLIERGMRNTDIKTVLKPAENLLHNDFFWRHQYDALAVFVSRTLFKYFRLTYQWPETAVVNNSFYSKPLIPLLETSGMFYIISLSLENIRLFKATRYSIAEYKLADVPKSLAEAIQYDDPERHVQYHTSVSGSSHRSRSVIYHGQGTDNDDRIRKKNIDRFLRMVAQGIHNMISHEPAPVVLAGIAYLQGYLRQADHHLAFLGTGITGNSDLLPVDELHRRALSIVEPILFEKKFEAVRKCARFAGTEHLVTDMEYLLRRAHEGRVDTLLIADTEEHHWGNFDTLTSEIKYFDEQRPEAEDLLDHACASTIRHGGSVFLVSASEMPDKVRFAGLLRY